MRREWTYNGGSHSDNRLRGSAGGVPEHGTGRRAETPKGTLCFFGGWKEVHEMDSIKSLVFEQLSTFEQRGADASPTPLSEGIFRAQVPGGWFILLKAEQPTLFFYPEPNHRWDGGSYE